jgi:hypothetical protein
MPLLSSSLMASMGSRMSFQGLTDRYSPGVVGELTDLELAVKGIKPFNVSGQLFSENFRDAAAERLSRYRNSWEFYDGNHWANPYDDGYRKPVFNYCSIIADKGSIWFAGHGLKILSRKGNEGVAELLCKTWEDNNHVSLLNKVGQYGAVTGDCFYYVTVQTTDEADKPLPKKDQKILITAINPRYCFPFWNENRPGEIDSILIQFPVMGGRQKQFQLYTIYITATTYEIWLDTDSQGKQTNPFGRVNVVYSKNLEQANSLFGQSDIEKIIPLNEEYNTLAFARRKIIHYHAEPTTIMYGVRASKLEKGANNVWSGLPIDAKVENLEMKGDANLVSTSLQDVEKQICYLSQTPKFAFDTSEIHISNTSGLAIQLHYLPLYEKTLQKQSNHSRAITQVNQLVLVAYEKILGQSLDDLADDPEKAHDVTSRFVSILPKDDASLLDQVIKKREAKLISRAEAMREVNDIQDSERHALELAADDRAELALAYEEQQAALGNRPTLSAVFLGSPFLSEDFEDLAVKSASFSSSPSSTEGG